MQHARYRLRDGALLGRLMRCPDPTGRRHTLRSLAEASGLSKSKIGYMLHDDRPAVTEEQAEAIAEAVGVHRQALFEAFPFGNEYRNGGADEPPGADAARPARGAHQLGEDP